jgi:hypothetical protein
VIGHADADLAPWNLRSHDTASETRPAATVDGRPLIFSSSIFTDSVEMPTATTSSTRAMTP